MEHKSIEKYKQEWYVNNASFMQAWILQEKGMDILNGCCIWNIIITGVFVKEIKENDFSKRNN